MQTERKLYLALRALMEEFHIDGTAEGVEVYDQAFNACEQFELELGPLPDWAESYNIAQEPVMNAQLYTKNGRRNGNAMIYHVSESSFGVITDMGNTMVLNRYELDSLFEVGDFILKDYAYELRKRQNWSEGENRDGM